MQWKHAVGFASAWLAAPAAFATCGSAFCTVNTNWDSHGAWAEPGWRLDLRYEQIKQDQAQTGDDRIAVGQIRRHHELLANRLPEGFASAGRHCGCGGPLLPVFAGPYGIGKKGSGAAERKETGEVAA